MAGNGAEFGPRIVVVSKAAAFLSDLRRDESLNLRGHITCLRDRYVSASALNSQMIIQACRLQRKAQRILINLLRTSKQQGVEPCLREVVVRRQRL